MLARSSSKRVAARGLAAALLTSACTSQPALVDSRGLGDASASDAVTTFPDAGSETDSGETDATPRDVESPDVGAPGDTGTPEAGIPDLGAPDVGSLDASSPDAGPTGTYRTSLANCWTDATCPRKMAIAHGGLWKVTSPPYDSNGALEAAFAAGIDGVKIDVRITRDNVPVISHSSPIEIYESLDCANRRIEDMTAAEVVGCHRFPSQTETFQRLDDVLNYLRGKMVTQLTVKRSQDYARTIQEVLALGAEDYAFLEINTQELRDLIPTIPSSSRVWYLINIESDYAQIDQLIDVIGNPRAFMYEMNPAPEVAELVRTRLHPAGVRSFTYDSSATASVRRLRALYDQGFDVVSAQTESNVEARVGANQAAGVSPP